MNNMILRRLMLATVLLLATAIPGEAAKTTRTSFDGSWSVLIITDAGNCDRTYRYGLRIAGGQLYYEGGTDVVMSGRVTPKGYVSVWLRRGDALAQGTGRLSRSSGAGRWQGASANLACSGRWQAERYPS